VIQTDRRRSATREAIAADRNERPARRAADALLSDEPVPLKRARAMA
jgi:hypothetical protein